VRDDNVGRHLPYGVDEGAPRLLVIEEELVLEPEPDHLRAEQVAGGLRFLLAYRGDLVRRQRGVSHLTVRHVGYCDVVAAFSELRERPAGVYLDVVRMRADPQNLHRRNSSLPQAGTADPMLYAVSRFCPSFGVTL
jgi:hypothetical protein